MSACPAAPRVAAAPPVVASPWWTWHPRPAHRAQQWRPPTGRLPVDAAAEPLPPGGVLPLVAEWRRRMEAEAAVSSTTTAA